MTLTRGLVAGIQGLTAILLLIEVAVNFANIVGRYVFSAPLFWAEEVMLFLNVGTVFFGNSVVGWEGRQIRMDVFLHMLPPAARHWLEALADFVMIVVSLAVIVFGWPVLEMLAAFDERSQAAEIPLVIPQALLPIGFGLTAILLSIRLVGRLWTGYQPSAEPESSDASWKAELL